MIAIQELATLLRSTPVGRMPAETRVERVRQRVATRSEVMNEVEELAERYVAVWNGACLSPLLRSSFKLPRKQPSGTLTSKPLSSRFCSGRHPHGLRTRQSLQCGNCFQRQT